MKAPRGLSVTEGRRLHFRLLDEEWEALRRRAEFEPLLEEARCPADCPQPSRFIFDKNGCRFHRCPGCGLVFVNPQLTAAALSEHFATSPAWQVWAESVLADPSQQAADRAKYRAALDAIAPLNGGTPGRVLDIGANSGVFLAEARAAGWEVTGVEPSRAACDFALRTRGISLLRCGFADYANRDEPFDLITFWASLEYHKDPAAAVAKALSLLAPGGLLLVLVSGNAHSLVMRVLREHCVGFLFNRPWYFTPDALDRLVRGPGIELVQRHSIIASLDVLSRWLDYRDPYEGSIPDLFSEEEIGALESRIDARHMGYKFQSIYRKAAAG